MSFDRFDAPDTNNMTVPAINWGPELNAQQTAPRLEQASISYTGQTQQAEQTYPQTIAYPYGTAGYQSNPGIPQYAATWNGGNNNSTYAANGSDVITIPQVAANWNGVYTNPQGSANRNGAYNSSQYIANWNGIYTNPQGSANLNGAYNSSQYIANWNGVYTNSQEAANRNVAYTNPQGIANWNATYTNPQGSANRNVAYTNPQGIANWNATYTNPQGSANRNVAYTNPQGSANRNVAYNSSQYIANRNGTYDNSQFIAKWNGISSYPQGSANRDNTYTNPQGITNWSRTADGGQQVQMSYVNRFDGPCPDPLKDPRVQAEINQAVTVARSMQMQNNRQYSTSQRYSVTTNIDGHTYTQQIPASGEAEISQPPTTMPADEVPVQAQQSIDTNHHRLKEVVQPAATHPAKHESAMDKFTCREKPEVISEHFLKMKATVEPMLGKRISKYYPELKGNEGNGCAAFGDIAAHRAYQTHSYRRDLLVTGFEATIKSDPRFKRVGNLRETDGSWDIDAVQPGDILIAERWPRRDNNGRRDNHPPGHVAIMWTNGQIANNDSKLGHIALSPVTKFTAAEYKDVKVYRPTDV